MKTPLLIFLTIVGLGDIILGSFDVYRFLETGDNKYMAFGVFFLIIGPIIIYSAIKSRDEQ